MCEHGRSIKSCDVCRKARARAYRTANPEKTRAARRRFYETHREEEKQYQRERYQTDEAYRARRKAHYDKERAVALTRERRRTNKLKGVELLGGKCVRCGYSSYIGALDFHHPDPHDKKEDNSRLLARSWAVIEAEILKLELLCANCHREVHKSDDLSFS